MGTIWKMVLTLAVILMITVTGMMVTNANVSITAAQNYMEEIAVVVKESNYSREVIRKCQIEARENGYELEIAVYGNQEHMNSSYAKICLSYQYRLPLFQISEKKKIEQII